MERYLKKRKLFGYIEIPNADKDILICNRITPNEFTKFYMIIINNNLHRPKIELVGFDEDECKEINDFIYNLYIMKKKLN